MRRMQSFSSISSSLYMLWWQINSWSSASGTLMDKTQPSLWRQSTSLSVSLSAASTFESVRWHWVSCEGSVGRVSANTLSKLLLTQNCRTGNGTLRHAVFKVQVCLLFYKERQDLIEKQDGHDVEKKDGVKWLDSRKWSLFRLCQSDWSY